ncbi:tRNA (5-methylaminomethyl-2-thiouridine)(34)-methyltransferase MnmD [Flavobacterium sp. MFBS3-15]|uniref:tRNA (5-methylaminomethyl-2-thiouridine)(34)-methyltransferase MnmD n=1 Tax=Flavobacterium sp. MFBS3-15 TaxID=2989816 RepID=UPI002236BEAE|nr:tRNA (5-methylaminomethyl-2-thiouridine)(34)-methyltransferase MnmD [Flavobacterium sp. MFBS3-15]MCW4467857.1 tRNA (5-methylaminomethyl-2-thiouridine)(34)-methyltransferase MnmD [Flavobacterium sp. MFBS3-15]
MERQIITTNDGSVTIYLPEMKETYHSRFGAIQEAYHVFIHNGLSLIQGRTVSILEIGFGTGLNAFITYLESVKSGQEIEYTGVEAFPIDAAEAAMLNYVAELKADEFSEVFTAMHTSKWGEKTYLNNKFKLTKRRQFFSDIEDVNAFDLIYFDAFGYHAQPNLWSEEIFRKMYNALTKDGILITYACRTVIKKAMQSVGFQTEKLPGPPGKREMLRAIKI